MSYIKLEQGLLICDHPLVSKIWESGHTDSDRRSLCKTFLNLRINGETISIENDESNRAILGAEALLDKLTIKNAGVLKITIDKEDKQVHFFITECQLKSLFNDDAWNYKAIDAKTGDVFSLKTSVFDKLN